MRVLILGCGYVGTALGGLLVRSGHEVQGVRRSCADLEELRATGIQPLIWDVTEPSTFPPVGSGWDWVVNALSSRGGGVEGYERLYWQGTRNVLEWLKPVPPRKYVHLSSTSVYGQADASEVTESSLAEPQNGTSQVLLRVEQLLLQSSESIGWPAVILRSAGIYGPDRGHLFQQFLAGEARLTGEGDRWLNMIHRDDLVGAILAAFESGRPGDIINVADDEPVTEFEFFRWLSVRLKQPLPPAIDPSEKVRKRGATNKRVANTKLKQALGYRLRFPTYREGYEAELVRLGKMPH
jgi:nucleoside-diphosphate-sugar epimerase